MKNELYNKLVDLYAGRELSQELEDELEMAAYNDPALSHDMATMRRTVETLQADRGPEFTEESYQRVLMKLYARGAVVESQNSIPIHLQYHLPIQG
jgi:hypothetical protein